MHVRNRQTRVQAALLADLASAGSGCKTFLRHERFTMTVLQLVSACPPTGPVATRSAPAAPPPQPRLAPPHPALIVTRRRFWRCRARTLENDPRIAATPVRPARDVAMVARRRFWLFGTVPPSCSPTPLPALMVGSLAHRKSFAYAQSLPPLPQAPALPPPAAPRTLPRPRPTPLPALLVARQGPVVHTLAPRRQSPVLGFRGGVSLPYIKPQTERRLRTQGPN